MRGNENPNGQLIRRLAKTTANLIEGDDRPFAQRWGRRGIAAGAAGVGITGAIIGGEAGVHAAAGLLTQTPLLNALAPFGGPAAITAITVGSVAVFSNFVTGLCTLLPDSHGVSPDLTFGRPSEAAYRRIAVIGALGAGTALVGAGVCDVAQMGGMATGFVDAAIASGIVAGMSGISHIPYRSLRPRPDRQLGG